MFGAIKLPSDRSPIPGQNDVGFCDAGDLAERFAPEALPDLRDGIDWNTQVTYEGQ